MSMATKHFRIVVLLIQLRRRIARNRIKRDMGWKPMWEQVRG